MTLALKSEIAEINTLESLAKLVNPSMQQVDIVIQQYIHSDVSLIEDLAKHLIFAGGKRIRPLLAIASAALFNHPEKAVSLAAAIEFIHTATLLHDDVVDDSNLRRGLTSAHKIWGNSASILVGDFLFARSFQLMVTTKNMDVLDILSRASAAIAAGEVLQLTHAHSFDLTVDISLQIIGAKTAELFAASCQTGALIAGASNEHAKAMYDYGYQLGIIFQIIDDILDYSVSNKNRGKEAGDDFREGKITLPIIYAYQQADHAEREFFQRTMIEGNQVPEDLDRAMEIVIKYQGFQKAKALAEQSAVRAREAISVVKGNDYFHVALKNLINFCLHREH